MSFISS
jgi:hypothetical protein